MHLRSIQKKIQNHSIEWLKSRVTGLEEEVSLKTEDMTAANEDMEAKYR